jgi:hypothetical protein
VAADQEREPTEHSPLAHIRKLRQHVAYALG